MTNSYHASVNGHGWEFGLDGFGDIMVLGSQSILDYYTGMKPRMSERLGQMRSQIFGSIASGSIFPNISFLPAVHTFRTWLPKGPHKFELRTWVIVNKAMPDEIKEECAKRVMLTFSPGGLFEMDDGENWSNCTTTNKGVVTRRQPLHYRAGLTRQIHDHPELPGTIYRGQYNDANQRLFFQRWADLMNAESVTELPDRRGATPAAAARI
jgi:ethylbenzene dioxygenase alpha subunit